MTDAGWQASPDGLPVFPVFYNAAERRMFGAIRVSPTGGEYIQVGCNIDAIPEFCGGIMLTSINVHVRHFAAAYADSRQRDAWANLPTLDTLFGDGGATRTLAAYAALPDEAKRLSATRVGRNDYQSMWNLGLASLATRIMVHSGNARRAAITYWDTRTGSTRQCVEWIGKHMSRGAHVQDGYQHMIVHSKEVGTEHFSYGQGAGAYGRHVLRVYPKRHVTSLYMHNRNSGNAVAASTLYVDVAPASTFRSDAPPVKMLYSIPTRTLMHSFLGTSANMFVPHGARFYPM